MPRTAIKEQTSADQQQLVNVGECLYRSTTSKRYYGISKRGGKQKKRSLRTTDRQFAEQRLREWLGKVAKLDTGIDGRAAFAVTNQKGEIVGGLLGQYLQLKIQPMRPNTRDLNLGDCQSFLVFGDKTVRNITLKDIEVWAARRRREVSPATFNRQLGLLKRFFAYAMNHGIRLNNPVEAIPREKLPEGKVVPPTREEFAELVPTIRLQSQEAGDFVEAEGYSGCRVSELGGDKKWNYPPLCWQGPETNVNFKNGTFTVVGKGRKPRTIPLFPAFRDLLQRMLAQLPTPPNPGDPVFPIANPRQSLATACRWLGWTRQFTNHDMRHFFVSNAIENLVDFKTIAFWLGHKDGGLLVAKTYGHLRQSHSQQCAARMTFALPR